jgi:hypothetical protein
VSREGNKKWIHKKKAKQNDKKRPKLKNAKWGNLEQVSAGGRERAEMHGSQSQAGCDRP